MRYVDRFLSNAGQGGFFASQDADVGSHDPQKRECDDEVVRKGRIIVDVMETSMREAGDILIPIANGTIKKSDVLGDLSDLCRSRVFGRQTTDDITVFKSTGSSLADMAAAELAVRNSVKRK